MTPSMHSTFHFRTVYTSWTSLRRLSVRHLVPDVRVHSNVSPSLRVIDANDVEGKARFAGADFDQGMHAESTTRYVDEVAALVIGFVELLTELSEIQSERFGVWQRNTG
jgi:hypothetical protein